MPFQCYEQIASSYSEHFTTPEFPSIVLTKLLQLQCSEKSCDVFITNEKATVSAHGCLLAAVSPFMSRYISSQATNCRDCSHMKKITLPISTVTKMMSDSLYNCMDCLLKIVKYIYTGDITISEEHFDHIVNISCNLEIEELIDICRDYKSSKKCQTEEIFESENDDSLDFPIYKISNSRKTVPSDNNSKASSNSYNKTNLFHKVPSDSLPDLNISHCNSNNTLEESAIKGKLPYSTNTCQISSNYTKLPVEVPDSEDNILESQSISKISDSCNITNVTNAVNRTCNASNEISCLQVGSKFFSQINAKSDDKVRYSDSNKNLAHNKNIHCADKNKNITDNLYNDASTVCRDMNDSHAIFEESIPYDNQKKASCKFKCLFCEFISNSRRRTAKHLLEKKHGNKCSICLKEFESSECLIQHVKKDHNFPLSYECNSCNLDFKTRHSLKIHLVTHVEAAKLIKCNMCNKAFVDKIELELHISKRHNNNEKCCDFCSYKTKFSSYLKRHLLKHNRKLISCSFPDCDFQTVWKSNLKSHIKIHKVCEKEFKCNICSMQFSLKKNLQRHILLMHNKCKTFTCPNCKYSNKRFDKVRTHYRNSHALSSNHLEMLNEQYFNLNLIDKKFDLQQGRSRHGNPEVNNAKLGNHTLPVLEKPNSPENTDIEISDASNGSDRVVYLNETTGELTFFCDSDGKPLKGVPDVITVHSISGMKSNNNFDPSTSTGVILNEITGELTCIQLNFKCNSDKGTVKKQVYPTPEVSVTVLDETTGEITSKYEQLSLENDNNMADFDNIFDAIDFEAMNDDSFDGFDDFDNALFDAEFSVGSSSPDMDKILNEYTGELFTDDSACRYHLDKHLQSDLWQSQKSSCHTNSQVEKLAQIFLDEVTGELTAEFSSLMN